MGDDFEWIFTGKTVQNDLVEHDPIEHDHVEHDGRRAWSRRTVGNRWQEKNPRKSNNIQEKL